MSTRAKADSSVSIGRLAIVGVGLIGGSLARALREAKACREIVGHGRSRVHLERALALGVIDRAELDIRRAVEGADVVVVAAPVGAMAALARELAASLEPKTILTDVGSVKGSVVTAVREAFGEVPANFVPGHPIAGTERSGVEAAMPDLFKGRRVILTPLAQTSAAAIERIRNMWLAVGALVSEMGVEHHDRVLAATSHLPHLLAYALVDALTKLDEGEEIFKYAAGGFRDFTRIAASDPTVWHDICLANADALLEMLAYFSNELERLAEHVRAGDSEALLEVLGRAKAARDRFGAGFNGGSPE